MRRLAATLRLIHPFPVSVVLATTFFLLLIANHGVPEWAFLARAFGVVLFSQIAVGALNDYVDKGVDARTQPDKPIPAGLVPPGYALLLTLGSIVGLITLG